MKRRLDTDSRFSLTRPGAAAAAVATFLPTVTSAPTMVLSPYRLVSSYSSSSPTCQIRGATGPVLQDVTVGADGQTPDWTAANALAGAKTFAKVYDQSGNALDAVQATVAAQPVYLTTNDINGYRPIPFGITSAGSTSSNKHLDLSGSLSVGTHNYTLFIVLAAGGGNGTWGIGGFGSEAGAGMSPAQAHSYYLGASNNARIVLYHDSSFPDANRQIMTGMFSIIAVTSNASNLLWDIDGSTNTDTAVTSRTLTGGMWGRGPWSSTNVGPMHGIAFILYPALSSTDRDTVRDSLRTIFETPSTSLPALIGVGDSNIQGLNVGVFMRNFMHLTPPLLNNPVRAYNLGKDNTGIADVWSNRAVANTLSNATDPQGGVIIYTTINDIRNKAAPVAGYEDVLWDNSGTPSTNSIIALVNYYRDPTRDRQVYVCSLPPASDAIMGADAAEKQTVRTNLNTKILDPTNEATYGYRAIDISAADTSADNLHLSLAGNATAATTAAADINAVNP